MLKSVDKECQNKVVSVYYSAQLSVIWQRPQFVRL